jgi:hypothetical protein
MESGLSEWGGWVARIDLSDEVLEEQSRVRACAVLTLGVQAQGVEHRSGDLTDADNVMLVNAAAAQLTYRGRKGLTGALTLRPHRRSGSRIDE